MLLSAESRQDWAVTDNWIMERTVDKLLYRGNYRCWIGSSTSSCRHTVQQLRYAADSLKEQCNILGFYSFLFFPMNWTDWYHSHVCLLKFPWRATGFSIVTCFLSEQTVKGGACHRHWLASLGTNSAVWALSPVTWSYWFATYPMAATFSRN